MHARAITEYVYKMLSAVASGACDGVHAYIHVSHHFEAQCCARVPLVAVFPHGVPSKGTIAVLSDPCSRCEQGQVTKEEEMECSRSVHRVGVA